MPDWVAFFITFMGQFVMEYSYWYRWKKAGIDPLIDPVSECDKLSVIASTSKEITIKAETSIKLLKKKIFDTFVTYKFYGDGSVKICTLMCPTETFKRIRISSIPRIGFSFAIRKDLCSITYFGLGPRENYPDRKSGSEMGVWNTSPDSMGFDYIFPCENGNRSNCSWVLFQQSISQRGGGLMLITGDQNSHFHFSALLHSQKELHSATHTYLLQDRRLGENSIYCNVDSHHMGIGGDVGWMPCVYDNYILKSDKEYSLK